jgi:hypothetical protein
MFWSWSYQLPTWHRPSPRIRRILWWANLVLCILLSALLIYVFVALRSLSLDLPPDWLSKAATVDVEVRGAALLFLG